MMIPVLGGSEEGGISWVDERDITPVPLDSGPDLRGNPQLIKWHVEQILARVARAVRATSKSVVGLVSAMAPR